MTGQERTFLITIPSYSCRVEFKASFPRRIISISDFQDMIHRIKTDYHGNTEKTRDEFVLRFRGSTVRSGSVEDLRYQLSNITQKTFFNIRISNLSFTIEHSEWIVSFRGSKRRRTLFFQDITNRKAARSKCDAYKNFWKKRITSIYESSKSRMFLLISEYIEYVDISLALCAIFGELINMATWPYLYSGNLLLYFPSLIFLIQIVYSAVIAMPMCFMLIRIDYWLDRNEAVDRLTRDKFSMMGVMRGNFSVLLRIAFIPLIILIYNDSLFLSIFPTLPHAFLQSFLDITPLYLTLTVVLVLVVKIVSTIIKGKALKSPKPIHNRVSSQNYRKY